MAVKLRLKRMGSKQRPFYRIVAADSRSPRDGKFIETVGTYQPIYKENNISVDEEKALKWLNNGAIPTDTVKNILTKSGIWAKYKMFQMKLSDMSNKGYTLKPVSSPDAIQLRELVGYDQQRKQVVDNTKALLKGLHASNILLYGSAGTGKSATVKAVANAFADDGLRLIELSKNELHLLPELLEELNTNPLKFILFIDDLSFQENDDDFSALKAVLEGSISARANNTVIYATSNRRHIVRETFSQRAGDEVHRNDTVQETISLSERFGIQILFDKPNKQLYLDIVLKLAEDAGLQTDTDTIILKAEQFAMRKSGRSARAARQFIEQLCCAEAQDSESKE